MATWLCCILLASAPILVTFVTLAKSRQWTRQPGKPTYLASLAVDHTLLVAEWSLVYAWLAACFPLWVAAMMAAAVLSAMTGWIALDATLFCRAGMRLRWDLFFFTPALVRMGYSEQVVQAKRLSWGAVCVGAVAYWVGLRSSAQPLSIGTWAATVGMLWCASLALHFCTTLPLSIGWNLRFITQQHNLVRAPVRWAVVNLRRDLRDADGVPKTLLPRHEEATRLDRRFPLLRQQTAFTGARHFVFESASNAKPHVVLLFLESFRAADVGVCGAAHATSITPCFDALARQGVLWRNCHASSTVTSPSMLAALYGVPPAMRAKSLQLSRSVVPMVGLPQIFSARGYLTACFTDAPMEYEHTRDFFLNHGFAAFYGTPSIKTSHPDAPEDLWNFDDAYLMRFHAAWLAKQQSRGLPTFSTVLTITNHVPYRAPPHAPWPQTAVPQDSEYGQFLRTMHYSDACLGQYIDALRDNGALNNTILMVVGDHGQEVENNAIVRTGRCSADDARVPLLLLAPNRVAPKVIDEVASHLDIQATLLDLLDIHTTHHGAGNSLVRVDPERQAYTFHSFAPLATAVQDASARVVYNIDADKTEMQPAKPDSLGLRLRRWQEVLVLRDFLQQLYDGARLAPPPSTELAGRAPNRFSAAAEGTIPQSIGAAANMLTALRNQPGSGGRTHNSRLALLTMSLHAADFNDAERVELVQLSFSRVFVDEVGELSDAEEGRLKGLLARVRVPADLDPFSQALMETGQQLARSKPFPQLRLSM